MRRSALLDTLVSGEYATRVVGGNGEPGSELTRRMSSDMGVDFLDEIVYDRLAFEKPREAGAGVETTGFATTAETEGDGGEDECAGKGFGSAFSFGV